jgi:hypothetical protein
VENIVIKEIWNPLKRMLLLALVVGGLTVAILEVSTRIGRAIEGAVDMACDTFEDGSATAQ